MQGLLHVQYKYSDGAAQNVGLSLQMVSYTKIFLFVAETFYSSGGSCVTVERKFGADFLARTGPSRDNIYQPVKQ
jgi:hypothetical protein